jgi:hypothetical protein
MLDEAGIDAELGGVVVDERPAAHGRIFERGDVYLGSIDERLHNLQMQVCDEHRGSLRRNQIRPPEWKWRRHSDVFVGVEFCHCDDNFAWSYKRFAPV